MARKLSRAPPPGGYLPGYTPRDPMRMSNNMRHRNRSGQGGSGRARRPRRYDLNHTDHRESILDADDTQTKGSRLGAEDIRRKISRYDNVHQQNLQVASVAPEQKDMTSHDQKDKAADKHIPSTKKAPDPS